MQGVVAGFSFVSAYAMAAGFAAVWRYLELAIAHPARRRIYLAIASVLSAVILMYGLSQAAGYQNSIHQVMSLPPAETARPFIILLVAIPLVLLAIVLGRVFKAIISVQANWFGRFVPSRVALIIGITTASGLFWLVGNKVGARGALRAMDATYAGIDRLLPPDFAAPADPMKTGSPSSLVR